MIGSNGDPHDYAEELRRNLEYRDKVLISSGLADVVSQMSRMKEGAAAKKDGRPLKKKRTNRALPELRIQSVRTAKSDAAHSVSPKQYTI